MSFLLTTLIPSYKRPQYLVRAIESWRKTAADPSCHEVIVRLSDKDPWKRDTLEYLQTEFANCRVFVGPHMRGYVDTGVFFTEMIQHARGEWFNIWDDDMTIEGDRWDEKLRAAPVRSLVVLERYQLGPSLYGPGSLDGVGTGGFLHLKTWKDIGETAVAFPPDTYMRQVAQRNNWPAYRLPGTLLNHDWQRPKDESR